MLIKGVLIHINPDVLPAAYRQAVRGHRSLDPAGLRVLQPDRRSASRIAAMRDRLFKRDFAGEMLERYPDLRLRRLRLRLPARSGVSAGRHHLVSDREARTDDAEVLRALRDAGHQARPAHRRRRASATPAAAYERAHARSTGTRAREELRDGARALPLARRHATGTASSRSAAARTAPTRSIRMLQLGLNPLCVTATTCDLSDDRPQEHREHQAARRRLRRVLAEPGRARASSTASRSRRSATSPGPSTSASSRSRCAPRCSSTCR